MADGKQVLVFNADLQKETEHTVDVDDNGEIVLTCSENGRTLKFPAGTTGAQLKQLLAKHKKANEGQKTVAALDAKKAALLADLGV
jgi:hypothetical protein